MNKYNMQKDYYLPNRTPKKSKNINVPNSQNPSVAVPSVPNSNTSSVVNTIQQPPLFSTAISQPNNVNDMDIPVHPEISPFSPSPMFPFISPFGVPTYPLPPPLFGHTPFQETITAALPSSSPNILKTPSAEEISLKYARKEISKIQDKLMIRYTCTIQDTGLYLQFQHFLSKEFGKTIPHSNWVKKKEFNPGEFLMLMLTYPEYVPDVEKICIKTLNDFFKVNYDALGKFFTYYVHQRKINISIMSFDELNHIFNNRNFVFKPRFMLPKDTANAQLALQKFKQSFRARFVLLLNNIKCELLAKSVTFLEYGIYNSLNLREFLSKTHLLSVLHFYEQEYKPAYEEHYLKFLLANSEDNVFSSQNDSNASTVIEGDITSDSELLNSSATEGGKINKLGPTKTEIISPGEILDPEMRRDVMKDKIDIMLHQIIHSPDKQLLLQHAITRVDQANKIMKKNKEQ